VLGRRLAQRLRRVLVREARPEAEPAQPVPGEPRHVRALLRVVTELQPGGQQQLATGEPRGGVLEL
jgi:hypothetical protein